MCSIAQDGWIENHQSNVRAALHIGPPVDDEGVLARATGAGQSSATTSFCRMFAAV